MSVADRFIAMVCEQTRTNRNEVSGATLLSDLKIDSLSFMDLVMRLEEAEGVVLSDKEVDNILEATYLSEIVSVFEVARRRQDQVT